MDDETTSVLPGEAARSAPLNRPWYSGITRYQWLILIIACAGWIFDVYEGQIFNITANQLLGEVYRGADKIHAIAFYRDVFLGVFLLGGTAGGLLFGTMADRWGRRPAMAVAILTYSLCSGLTYFASSLAVVGALRFLVAIGVGGEWAVAASLVAEVFPARSRAQASGIFHASSVLGTWAATLAAIAAGLHWRNAYLIGIIPALLVAWVMGSVKEPEAWRRANEKVEQGGKPMGSLKELLTDPRWSRRAILGMLLASLGLGTFWAVTVAGQELVKQMLVQHGAAAAEVRTKSQFAYGIIQTLGGGLGLLAFGPLSVRFGRKRAFQMMMIGAFIIVPITCYAPKTYTALLWTLPVFGFLTLGMHAGFAIYFPELFPTHLRATGASFCFNVGRALAGGILVFSGWLKTAIDLRAAVSLLGLLFLVGLIVIWPLPETRGEPLPE